MVRIWKFQSESTAKHRRADCEKNDPAGVKWEQLDGYLIFAQHAGWLHDAPLEHRIIADAPTILKDALGFYSSERVTHNASFYNRYRIKG